ncbi:MAG: DUF2207 domain-containing protein, partial [Gemmatimonadales bacterium]
ILSAALALAATTVASAQTRSLRIRDFDALLTVHTDGTLDVVETIMFGFSGQWNGIVRDLSLEHNTAQGRRTKLDVDIIGVTDAGGSQLRMEQEKKDNGWTRSLRIWVPGALDADRAIVIRYRVNNAIRFFFKDSDAGELDELYWNVTGNGWDVPNERVHARVVLPPGVTPTREAVYTGAGGSKASAAQVEKAGNGVSFTTTRELAPYEGMTIGVGWQPGHITSRPNQASMRLMNVVRYWPAAIPFLVFWLAYRSWNKRGRDPEELSYVVRYEPVDKLSPAESGTLIDNKADMEDITATLVDLAVRGYVRIEEVTEKHLLGLTSSTDYVFHFLEPTNQRGDLALHEQRYLEGLTELAPIGENSVRLSYLSDKFYKSLSGIRDAIYKSLIEKGYYLRRPDQVKTAWMVSGVFVFMAGFFVIGMSGGMGWAGVSIPALLFAMVASAVTLIVFGLIMPARTVPGARAREATLGFKEFLGRVESERYRKMITSPEMFERYLPYAMAFGVAAEWARAFESMNLQPPT